MKVTYSLKEFRQKVIEISSISSNPDAPKFVSVRVEIDVMNNMIFSCYASGYRWHSASTIEESLNKLRDEISSDVSLNIEMDLEIETDITD